MTIDVTDVLTEMLARNHGPDPLNPDMQRQPDYGVAATLDGNVLIVALTFRRNAAYCCAEWGCHLALNEGERWGTLRQTLAARGVTVPARLELRLSCVIEEGAEFFDPLRPHPVRRGWYSFKPSAAARYEVSATEAAATQDVELPGPARPNGATENSQG